MTQRIFDVENEKDMADLWGILPDRVFKIHTSEEHTYYSDGDETQYFDVSNLIAINWHDKTEITRPIREATEADLGKLCMFWDGNNTKDYTIGLLQKIDDDDDFGKFKVQGTSWWQHCRRLTADEVKELC